ncbi:hypothetical protein H9P43_003541 [Blastocladiella emersonii ATCC 22665]|nr:hypothetical protein H9P43_003541 [Blastocladiella emersonii ATCC 22665]
MHTVVVARAPPPPASRPLLPTSAPLPPSPHRPHLPAIAMELHPTILRPALGADHVHRVEAASSRLPVPLAQAMRARLPDLTAADLSSRSLRRRGRGGDGSVDFLGICQSSSSLPPPAAAATDLRGVTEYVQLPSLIPVTQPSALAMARLRLGYQSRSVAAPEAGTTAPVSRRKRRRSRPPPTQQPKPTVADSAAVAAEAEVSEVQPASAGDVTAALREVLPLDSGPDAAPDPPRADDPAADAPPPSGPSTASVVPVPGLPRPTSASASRLLGTSQSKLAAVAGSSRPSSGAARPVPLSRPVSARHIPPAVMAVAGSASHLQSRPQSGSVLRQVSTAAADVDVLPVPVGEESIVAAVPSPSPPPPPPQVASPPLQAPKTLSVYNVLTNHGWQKKLLTQPPSAPAPGIAVEATSVRVLQEMANGGLSGPNLPAMVPLPLSRATRQRYTAPADTPSLRAAYRAAARGQPSGMIGPAASADPDPLPTPPNPAPRSFTIPVARAPHARPHELPAPGDSPVPLPGTRPQRVRALRMHHSALVAATLQPAVNVGAPTGAAAAAAARVRDFHGVPLVVNAINARLVWESIGQREGMVLAVPPGEMAAAEGAVERGEAVEERERPLALPAEVAASDPSLVPATVAVFAVPAMAMGAQAAAATGAGTRSRTSSTQHHPPAPHHHDHDVEVPHRDDTPTPPPPAAAPSPTGAADEDGEVNLHEVHFGPVPPASTPAAASRVATAAAAGAASRIASSSVSRPVTRQRAMVGSALAAAAAGSRPSSRQQPQ